MTKMRETWLGIALVFRLSALTIGATFVPLLIGIWIDRTIGTAPFGALTLIVLGILGGTVGVYRTVQDAYRQVSALHHKDNSDRHDSRGGD